MNRLRTFCYFVFAIGVAPLIIYPAGPADRPSLNAFVPDDAAASAPKVEPKAVIPLPELKPESKPETKVEPKPAPKPEQKPEEKPAPKTVEKPVETPAEALIPAAELSQPEVLSDESAKSIFEESEENDGDTPIETQQKSSDKKEPFVVIKKNEKLSSLIDKIAAKKGLNVILPHGSDIIKETITFDAAQKMPLSKAVSYMYMFLTMTGYRVRPDNGFFIVSRVTDNNLSREPLPLFVNVPPEDLPQNDSQIRAIYYLANFRVPSDPGGNDPLNLILKDMLGAQKAYLFDRKTNAVILIASARKIASAMRLIIELDNTGTPDDLQVIPLYNVPAPAIAKMLNEQIIATAQDSRRTLRNDPMAQEDLYFAPNTRVVADPRTNSLIVLGQAPAVKRIRDLIRDYIDLPPESGKSIIHVYDLQYLRSKELAEQLIKIVAGADTEQSRKETGGSQKFFDNVKIIPEEVEDAPVAGGSGSKISTRSTIGGNRLIIAATNDDWLQIKSLIEQLDKPELQVILEVMIVDLTVTASKALGAQTRNPSSLNLPAGFQFQTAQLYTQIIDSTPTTLATDMLKLVAPDTSPTKSIAQVLTTGADMGAMIISLKDPNTDSIWSVLALLDKWTERKVLSHPFLITKNNYAAHETNIEVRRNAGAISENNSAVTTVKQTDYKATLSVNITPRISSVDRLNMQVNVLVENFVDSTGQNKVTRNMETNASLGSGQILVIGGLSQVGDSEEESGWPLLSKLPIIGNLFKTSTKGKARTNLAIFIHPTIVDPKLRSGINKYTDDAMKECEKTFDSSYLFSSLRDPVTRIFFNEPRVETAIGLFEEYNRESAAKPKPDSLDTVAFNISGGRELEELRERMESENNSGI